MKREDIDRYADDNGIALLIADGFDDAIIGVCIRKGSEECVAYDYDKCVEILQVRDKMTLEEAEEYMEYNVIDAYVGKHTPCFII